MLFWSQIAEASTFMPPQASTFAHKYDALYKFLVDISVISCLLVIGGMVYFAFKYRRRSEQDKTAYISHNALLEFLWSFIPFVLFMVVFAWGWYVYHEMRKMPENALEIHIVGQKWNWQFQYKSGRTSSDLYVPVDTPVKLIMTSKDVIHSFFVPAFRMKQDVVPGRYSSLWFNATKVGQFHVFCAEYCGDGHSAMLTKVHVVPKAKYDEWLSVDPYKGLSSLEIGTKIFNGRCVACHKTNNERLVGPGLGGKFGTDEQLEGGGTAHVDENYLRESILYPDKQKVLGYKDAVMTSFQGQLTEQELAGVIEFVKSLK